MEEIKNIDELEEEIIRWKGISKCESPEDLEQLLKTEEEIFKDREVSLMNLESESDIKMKEFLELKNQRELERRSFKEKELLLNQGNLKLEKSCEFLLEENKKLENKLTSFGGSMDNQIKGAQEYVSTIIEEKDEWKRKYINLRDNFFFKLFSEQNP